MGEKGGGGNALVERRLDFAQTAREGRYRDHRHRRYRYCCRQHHRRGSLPAVAPPPPAAPATLQRAAPTCMSHTQKA